MKPMFKIFVICYVIILCYSSINALRTKFKAVHPKCAISTISIPKGSNLPVIVFHASMDEEAFDLTVVERDHLSKYNVNGNVVFDDKSKGESWYAEKKYDEKTFENMRDAFSMCKSIHEENKEQKLYDQNEGARKNNSLMKFRISELPGNMSLIEDGKEKNVSEKLNGKEKSENGAFLQTNTKKKNFMKNEKQIEEKKVLNVNSFMRLKEMFKPNDIQF